MIIFFVILLFSSLSSGLKSIEEIVHESNIQTEDSTGWISIRNQKCKEIESIVWFEKLVDMLYPKEGSVQYAFYPNNSKHCSCLNDTLRLDTTVTDLFWEYGKAHILMGYKEMIFNVLILQSTMKANLHGHHKTTTTTKTPATTGAEQPVSTLEVTTGAEQPVSTLEVTTGAEIPISTLEVTTGAEIPISTLETTTGAEQPVSTLETTTGAEQPVSTLETTTGAEQPVSTLELNKVTQPPMEAFSTSKSKSPSSKTSKSKSPSSKTSKSKSPSSKTSKSKSPSSTTKGKPTSPPKDNNHIEEMGQKHDVTKSNVVTPPADSSSTTTTSSRVAIILLGSFSLLVVFVILAITIRKPAAVDPSKKQDDSVDVYGFETLDDFAVVDTKKQDQAILRSLGKGASELFDANL